MNGERKRGSQIINRDTQRLYFERTLHSLNLCDMIWSASEDVSIGRKKMSPGEKHDEQYMVELHDGNKRIVTLQKELDCVDGEWLFGIV
jgi:hypothetical protein